ncbi:hypothetical protein TFLX_00345 [Thermoflexales bacterium]|nr:hypothetical protein TFLX_00345 [Thermoflexales bacterium]
MTRLSRRQFLAALSATAAAAPFTPILDRWLPRIMAQGSQHHLYIARNGTPITNVQRAVALAGGIQTFIGHDDAVVLKPNGQWPLQGYTHTQALKALIDVILNRPGGFAGEIIITEHVHRDSTTALNGSFCWNMSSGYNRTNNWADMNYFELVNDYHTRGINNVTAIPLYDTGQSADFVTATGPGDLAAGKHGWVRATYTTTTNARTVRLSHALLRSSYSNHIIDLKHGVWHDGGYTGQPVKVIFLPTLNNHGSYNSEDYAGPTSALKCHLGIVEFAGSSGVHLHDVGYSGTVSPQAMGESVGHLITQILQPAFYLTVAEYTGYRSRTTTTAANTKTVGLCADPVTLDYWMCKYVMYPCATSQTFMNPDNDNHLRQALIGCQGKGVGTIDEAEMTVHLADINLDKHVYLPLVRK